jgi:hypothetical protein
VSAPKKRGKAPPIGKLRIEERQIADLKPAAYNPRTISKEQLAGLRASISRFGFVEPIVFNERTGNVVGGHRRLEVLQAENATATDVVVVDLDDLDERALNVALNNPHIQGDFDMEALERLLEEIRLEGGAELFADLRFDAFTFPELGENDPNAEWDGMPEFSQEDKTAFRSIVVHFKDAGAVAAFAKTVKQKITDKTRMLWYPEIEIERLVDKAYVDS